MSRKKVVDGLSAKDGEILVSEIPEGRYILIELNHKIQERRGTGYILPLVGHCDKKYLLVLHLWHEVNYAYDAKNMHDFREWLKGMIRTLSEDENVIMFENRSEFYLNLSLRYAGKSEMRGDIKYKTYKLNFIQRIWWWMTYNRKWYNSLPELHNYCSWVWCKIARKGR